MTSQHPVASSCTRRDSDKLKREGLDRRRAAVIVLLGLLGIAAGLIAAPERQRPSPFTRDGFSGR